jgi:hypothetical protein
LVRDDNHLEAKKKNKKLSKTEMRKKEREMKCALILVPILVELLKTRDNLGMPPRPISSVLGELGTALGDDQSSVLKK